MLAIPYNFVLMLIQVLLVKVKVFLFLAVERQLQQTSLKEWVTRKKSSGSTGTPDVSVVSGCVQTGTFYCRAESLRHLFLPDSDNQI